MRMWNGENVAASLVVFVLAICLATTDAARGGEIIPERIHYQGSLKQAGVPVTGECDFIFTLYEGSSTVIAEQSFSIDPEMPPPLNVVNGLFETPLDFGEFFTHDGPFSVEVAVRCPAGAAGPMETLSPRTLIQPVPLAYHAMTVERPDGNSLDALDGSPSNAVYVDAEGFVGLGTATPSSDLHIRKNASNVRLGMRAGASWTAILEQTDASILSLSNGGSKRFVLEPGGDVGIGTETPSARLDVVGGSDPQLEVRTSDSLGDDAGIIIQGARNGSTDVDAAYIDLRDFDSDEGPGGTEFSMAKIGAGMSDVSGETGFLRFHTNGGSGLSERMRIADDGAVGIGTTDPLDRLHVSGGENTGLSAPLRVQSGGQFMLLDGNEIDCATGALFLQNNSTFDVIVGEGGGRLGVGLANPTARLHVQSNTASSSSNTAEFYAPSIGSNRSHIHHGTAGDWYIRSASPSGEVILQDLGGNVGVGTSSPTAKLDVNGDLHVRGDITQPIQTCTRRYLPMDFRPTVSGKAYSIGFELAVPLSAAGESTEFVTHVRLPEGARVAALRALVDDSSASNEVAVEFWSGFGVDDRIVRRTTTAIPGLVTLSASLNHVFDTSPSSTGYRIELRWTRPPNGLGDIKVRWVELDYETDQACLPQ